MSLKKHNKPAKPTARQGTRATRNPEMRKTKPAAAKVSRSSRRPDRTVGAKPAAGDATPARKPIRRPLAATTARKHAKAPVPKTVKTKPVATVKAKPTATAKAKPTATAKAKPTATAKAKPTATAKAKPAATAKAKPAATAKAKPVATVKAKPAVRFSDADLQEFHNLLTKLRNDLAQKVTFLHNSSLRREDEVNQTEDGTDAFERLFSLERAGGVQQRIYAIDEALREIAEGTYGICQSCESLIRKQRLLALPFARNCLDCQAAQERRRLGNTAATAPRRFVP